MSGTEENNSDSAEIDIKADLLQAETAMKDYLNKLSSTTDNQIAALKNMCTATRRRLSSSSNEEAIPSKSTRIDQTTEMHEELPSTSTRPDRNNETDNSVSKACDLQYELIRNLVEQFFYEGSDDLQKFEDFLENGRHLSRRDISKNKKGFYGLFQLLVDQGKLHLGKYSLLRKFGEITKKVEIGNYIDKYEKLIEKELGQNVIISKKPGSDSSEKLKKLLGEADLQLKAYRQHEGAVFIEPPAFKACQDKLEKGVVTIVGASGDGKTTIAKELLLRQTKRLVVIIADEDDWKKVDLAQNENLLILFDDMLGKFVSDSYKYWKTKLDKIFDAVRSGKIQVVITCRETVLSRCREEIEHFQLFKPENRVHLSGPNSTCNLDTDTKRKMIQKLIDSTSNISICDKLDDENLSGNERKISLKSLEQIALKNCPGFPQCCYTFVSMPACFSRGDKFFDNPTEYLIKEIDRMRISDDKIDQFNYCTLVCVLFYGTLTVDTVEQEIEKIKLIANSCGIMITTTLPTEMQKAATRLSTSYLVGTRNKGFTFQHNSLLETIFTSFFESQPKLLIEHCAFNLIQSLVTTEQASEKSDLFCEIQSGTQIDCLCSRLATEIMSSNVMEAVGHRTLTDPVFVSKFFSHINTSSNKKTVLQSTEDNKSILYLAARVSDKCFVEKLLTELESIMSIDTMEEKMSRALCGACFYGNYGVFTLLMSRPGVKVFGGCLCDAAYGGDDRIVTDLLSVRKWSTRDVTQALYSACSEGRYDMYRSLITHNVTAIDDGCLWMAVSGGHDRIVTNLLSVRKWSTHDVTQALYQACLCGRYDVYRLLITHNVTAIDDEYLWRAASGGHDRIVTDLLSVRKWSTHHVTQALYKACFYGRYDVYRSLITHDVTAIDDKCLYCAASGGDDRIVTDLLSVRKWSTDDVTQALYGACSKGRYDVYRSLITHNVTVIDVGCLWWAVRGGNTKIKDDLLSKGYKLPDSDTD